MWEKKVKNCLNLVKLNLNGVQRIWHLNGAHRTRLVPSKNLTLKPDIPKGCGMSPRIRLNGRSEKWKTTANSTKSKLMNILSKAGNGNPLTKGEKE